MKTNIIQEIWDICGMVDKAIDTKDVNLYNKAREKFNDIFQHDEHLLSFSTSTVGYEPENVKEMLSDREQNFAQLAYEFGRSLQKVQGQDYEIEELQFSSCLELIWWSRWMLDNFVLNQKNGVKDEVNMLIFNAIDTNLRETVNYYENFEDEISKNEQSTLIQLHMEATSIYDKLYGDKEDIDDQEI